MLRKSFAFFLLVLLGTFALTAQDVPKPEKPEKPPKAPSAPKLSGTYSFSFGGSAGYLGIHMGEVTKNNYSKYGLKDTRGVAVEKVLKDSPAEKAGLQKNDVIVRFNGEAVTSMRKLSRLISEVAPDHKVSITVLRSGSEQDLSATMGKRDTLSFANTGGRYRTLRVPGVPGIPRSPEAPMRIPFPEGKLWAPSVWRMSSSRTLGVTVTTLTDQLRVYFGVEKDSGLLVKSVKKDSPAAKAGLKAGDVITKIDGKPVKNTFDISRALSSKKEGAVDLTYVRDKRSNTVKVTPEKREITPRGEFYFSEPSEVND
ncbi:MAG: PDZ domain-containing protein [Pyrinomonadaceae bacterium]|nr:PDZ domain-containing protein [Pyrinomonadaceae bacterium]